MNEDLNSSPFVIVPGSPAAITQYMYSPNPGETGSDGTNGGTDAISVAPDGTVYIAHSNPDLSLPGANNTAAVFKLSLGSTIGHRHPGLRGDRYGDGGEPDGRSDGNRDGFDGSRLQPLPPGQRRNLAQVAQADSKIVFASNLGAVTPTLTQLNLTNAVTPTSGVASTPQIDDIERVTGKGTFYAVDQGSGTIYAIDTSQVAPGTVFASQPNPASGDQPNDPALGVVDLTTGVVTHVDSTLKSPKGLLFVPAPAPGYWEVASDGGIFGFGSAKFFGSMGGTPLNKPVVGIAAAPDGQGYWEVASDAGIFGFGAHPLSGPWARTPLNKPVGALPRRPMGKGTGRSRRTQDLRLGSASSSAPWAAPRSTSRWWPSPQRPMGRVLGGTVRRRDLRLRCPPVLRVHGRHPAQQGRWRASARRPTGRGTGRSKVPTEGFASGSAKFFGSMGGTPLNKPVVGIAAAPDGQGYWEVASDGGIFGFGSAKFFGSMGGTPLNKPVAGMTGGRA